ncbi:MAG: UTP--glucose-1-phosphate uridylyltransferase [Candidatus Sumerlaeaceae bacterium]|nr:UTP--glucose-1-phosphate uridylyltransferase [Candidatus Sumerlaeaceae bacterium]
MNPTNPFIETIVSPDPAVRNRPLRDLAQTLTPAALMTACEELEEFRRTTRNLYERVRSALFLHALYRYHLADAPQTPAAGHIPADAHTHLMVRHFEQAIAIIRARMREGQINGTLLSALAEAYHRAAFQTLLDQVRQSVRASAGNRWMLRVGHPDEHPLRIRPELLTREPGSRLYPVLVESTPVRLDLSHSGWSDIFFLGMDYPEGARVLNISVDLGVHGRDRSCRPPVSACVRVIPEPLLRLTSVDLGATRDITDLSDLFNFGNDYLGLLKAGVIASGLLPSSFEGTDHSIAAILGRVVGRGLGIELVTRVNDIPKGSRLAVSTTLLACVITALMRATGQTLTLEGSLTEAERRLVASRAILGEWLGGSGGGWQDSGGIWPGFKVIEGAVATPGDPEFGISRGCLLPRHRLLGDREIHPRIRESLENCLILVHGGMAQNVGPILELVTEKYLLRGRAEWEARLAMRAIFDDILRALREGDLRALGRQTTRNWDGPLKTIIPAVTNHFTEQIIAKARERLRDDFWGFLMLGGMSGGGMGMFVNPRKAASFRDEILEIMTASKRELEDALPFAMDPVVYRFEVNHTGTCATLLRGAEALLPSGYYTLQIPELVREHPAKVSPLRLAEFDQFTASATEPGESFHMLRTIVTSLFRVSEPASRADRLRWDADAERIRRENTFDEVQHEQMRADLRAGRIGLARNRLPVSTDIEDVQPGDVTHLAEAASYREAGLAALQSGRVAVLTLAGGVGSRWTSGAGAVKAVNPFVFMSGRHRCFLEIHLAKTRRAAAESGAVIPHLVSTSYLTHGPISKHLTLNRSFGHDGPIYLSPGRAIGQRLVPMVRDLQFLWEETPQETLDERRQRVRDAARRALMEWARASGEGSDYTDNVALQRFNPPGHWYEVTNLFRNGVLATVLREHPGIQTILLHNIDTLGACPDPAALGAHLASGNTLTFEVVPRRVGDHGGGLARVNGRVRLLEGLAQPHEFDELRLRYYNSMTTWIEVDPLLALFGLTRSDLDGPSEEIAAAIRRVAQRLPVYVTIKDVKRRWGHGQEDIYPVAQFERLWSDMTALADVSCGFLVVDRKRGQQLKSPSELDPWIEDGSRDHVARLAGFA